jgi:NADH dehydrogenase
MQRTLVVGATGQTGFATVRRLLAQGVNTRALVRDPAQTATIQTLGAEAVTGDLTDPASLRRACDGISVVVSTANAAVPTRSTDTFEAVERDGYRNLIEAAAAAKVQRFVYTSVLLSRYAHLSPFLQYKRATEAALEASGLDYVIFRAGIFMDVSFAMMGSAIPLRGAEASTVQRPFAFANNHFAKIRDSIEVRRTALIPGSGTTRHSFICVSDVADYLASAAVGGPSGLHTIGGPEPMTFLDVVALYERILGFPLRVRRTPAAVFRIAATVMRRFSPAGANLMALNYIAAREETVIDTAPARAFGVRLTSAEEFLQSRTGMAATVAK